MPALLAGADRRGRCNVTVVGLRMVAPVLLGAVLLAACGGGHSSSPGAAVSSGHHRGGQCHQLARGARHQPWLRYATCVARHQGPGHRHGCDSCGVQHRRGSVCRRQLRRRQGLRLQLATRSTATFSLSGVVPGFAEGIVGMKAGGRREIVIPPSLGYGASGSSPAVSPNETLVLSSTCVRSNSLRTG